MKKRTISNMHKTILSVTFCLLGIFGVNANDEVLTESGKLGIGVLSPQHKVDVDGQIKSEMLMLNFETVTSPTHTASTKSLIFADTSSNKIELSLPGATANPGVVYEIKMITDANYVDIIDSLGENIGSLTGLRMEAPSADELPYVRLVSEQGKWQILNDKGCTPFDNSYQSTKAWSVNGTDEYININENLGDWTPSGDKWTYMVWVKSDSVSSSSQTIIGGRRNSTIFSGRLACNQTQAWFTYNRPSDSAEMEAHVNFDLIDGEWHLVMVASDGTDLFFYIDGQQITDGWTGAGKGGACKQWTAYNGADFARQHYGELYYYEGLIDELSCIEADLSDQAVEYYNAGKPKDVSSHANLLYYFKGGEAGDDMTTNYGVLDSGPNLYHGTAGNMDATNIVTVSH